jgi:UDP-3-O-[3-hydroxymyristoyl] glucosamine N-acyltransferase
MSVSLADLAARFQLEVDGDAGVAIHGVCALSPGKPGALAFLADNRHKADLSRTAATAVVLRRKDRALFAGPALIAADPALAFVGIAGLFDRSRRFAAGVHPSAVVADTALLGEGVGIAPLAVVEDAAEIGAGSYVGPGCVIRRGARIGAGSWLEARVFVGCEVRIGARARILAGAVIGERGFGLAISPQGWVEVPQLGTVRIGDDVEIGANTTIDRGAIDDTVIEEGVKIDNLVQIAHNCRIGAHTAIAACVGIAGSTTIGKRCMIGGGAGIAGHLEIADGSILLGGAMVAQSLARGVYGSQIPALPAAEWRRMVPRIHRLGAVEQRLSAVEKQLNIETNSKGTDDV